jgi:magnesium transporter
MTDKENYSLSENVKSEILDLLEKGSKNKVNKIFSSLHPANQSDLILGISSESREQLLLCIGANINAQFLSYLENDIKNEVVDFLGAKNSAKAINKLEIDDAIEIIEDLREEGIDEILSHVSKDKRTEIEEALSYEEDSIGRVMHQDFIAIKEEWTVGEATSYLQDHKDIPDDFQYVIIVDGNYSPVSEIPVGKMLTSSKDVKISNLMPKYLDMKKINVNSDQERVARLFSRYSLTYAPVVNDNDILVGAISVADIVDIIEEEAQEDLLLLGGVNNSNLYSSSFLTAKSRAPWLFTSLLTTSLAVTIIALFAKEIEKAVVLAVLLPIIASLSGNAGTQALTVLIRSIATNEINNIGSMRVLFKEVWVGSFNGLFLACISGIICYLWKHDLSLSMVLSLSIFLTIILAGFFGAVIPILLNKTGFDPAISSGVFLIAITDTSSFLIFLGLASMFIL